MVEDMTHHTPSTFALGDAEVAGGFCCSRFDGAQQNGDRHGAICAGAVFDEDLVRQLPALWQEDRARFFELGDAILGQAPLVEKISESLQANRGEEEPKKHEHWGAIRELWRATAR